MVGIVGGIILMKIGFELFSPSASGGVIPAGGADQGSNIAFVPLAMPLMCGPGPTILGMTATIKESSTEFASFVAIVAAIFATSPTCVWHMPANFLTDSAQWASMRSPESLASSSRQWELR
jgi:small neutral amino acid transporter SnatA (MarC family)